MQLLEGVVHSQCGSRVKGRVIYNGRNLEGRQIYRLGSWGSIMLVNMNSFTVKWALPCIILVYNITMFTSDVAKCKQMVNVQWEISPRAGPIEREPAVVEITRCEVLETISDLCKLCPFVKKNTHPVKSSKQIKN
jgi:hypothetical protein